MPAPAQVALVILGIAATLWITEAVPLFVTSFGVLLLNLVWLEDVMRRHGQEIAPSVFLEVFFSDIILLFLGGFVLASALHKYRIDQDLARWIMDRTGDSVPRLMLGIMGVTAFLSMWLSNTATTAMMLAMCLPIVERLAKTDARRKAILLSIPLAANVGGIGTPIGTPPNAIALQYLERAGGAPTFAMWILLALPVVLFLLGLVWAVLLLLFRGGDEPVRLDPPGEGRRYGGREIFVIAVAVVTAGGWITGAWHPWSSGTVALLPVILFFGSRTLTVRDLRSLSWDVLLLMGGGLCLGRSIQVSGLAAWLIERLPVGGMEVLWIAVVFGALACLMSSLMSNTATANLVLPIVVGLSVEPISPILLGVAFSCSLAMPLPISTPPNAMAFATDELAVRDMLRPGLLATVGGLLFLFVVGFWWWGRIGLA
jgi:sodium-dependent dicarboxylate transporter 2/3/5